MSEAKNVDVFDAGIYADECKLSPEDVKHLKPTDDKTLASCRNKFNNALNFGGSPEPTMQAYERSAAIICIHALGLALANIGKLDDDGLCFCEARATIEPSLRHKYTKPALMMSSWPCVYCTESESHDLHKPPYQRTHSDKCLRARTALDEFGEWLKTEKAGKTAPVAPEGVNAPESTS